MLKVNLINGRSFTIRTKDFVKGTKCTVIRNQTGRNTVLANWYIISNSPI